MASAFHDVIISAAIALQDASHSPLTTHRPTHPQNFSPVRSQEQDLEGLMAKLVTEEKGRTADAKASNQALTAAGTERDSLRVAVGEQTTAAAAEARQKVAAIAKLESALDELRTARSSIEDLRRERDRAQDQHSDAQKQAFLPCPSNGIRWTIVSHHLYVFIIAQDSAETVKALSHATSHRDHVSFTHGSMRETSQTLHSLG